MNSCTEQSVINTSDSFELLAMDYDGNLCGRSGSG